MPKLKMYNPEIKNQFIKEIAERNEKSAAPYKRIIGKSADMEELLEKDLYSFDKEELIDFMTELAPLTPTAAEVNGRIISSYINWAKKNKFLLAENPLEAFVVEDFNQFVDQNKMIFMSEDYLHDIIGTYVKNPQDQALLILPFEGVLGLGGTEIRFLRRQDIDVKRRIIHVRNVKEEYGGGRHIIEVKEERDVEISQMAMDIIVAAMDQLDYWRRNGRVVDASFGETTKLARNNYVIRTAITKSEYTDEPTDSNLFFRRIAIVNKSIKEPYLQAKLIWKSGMIKMGKDLLESEGQLEKEQYQKICHRFGVKPEMWYTLKEYCNVENIKKLYPTAKIKESVLV